MKVKPFQPVLLIPLLLFNVFAQSAGIEIVVLEGQDGFNNIKQRINPEPIVEVRDAGGNPVADATVTFYLPPQGPSGTFANGTYTLTVTTDTLGRAAARGMHPNDETGRFEIRVRATYHGETASATIAQTNVNGNTSRSGNGSSFSTKAWVILAICAGAVAGAVIAATHKSGSSGPPPIVITPGSPTVGAPK